MAEVVRTAPAEFIEAAAKTYLDDLTKGIGTFKTTPNGLQATNPEGYVAVDKKGKAVKLVDRLEFSIQNFTAAKNWDKK